MKNIKLIKYMLEYIWKADRGGFFWAGISLMWTVIPTAFNVLIYKLLIDGITLKKSFIYIMLIVSAYSLTQLISRVFSIYIYEYRFNRLSLNVEKYSTILFMKKSLTIDSECFDDSEFYDKLSRALSQVGNRAMQVFYQLMRLTSSIINFLVGITIFIILDPIMILIALISGVAMFLLDIKFVKINFKAKEEMTPIERRVNYFKGILYNKQTASDIKQYEGLGNLLVNKYMDAEKKRCDASMELAGRKMRHNIKSQSLVVFTLTLTPYIYLAIQAYRMIITVSNIPSMFSAFNLIVDGFSESSREITNLKESCLYIEQLYQILDYAPKIERKGGREVNIIQSIEFINVSFKYPGTDKFVLSNINLSIKNGQKIAIVGLNGEGKTTLIKLLLRYYDVCGGQILINGLDIKELDIMSLREKISTLFQDYQTYYIPIREIISCNDASDKAKVIDVLHKVGLSDVVGSNEINNSYGRQFDTNGIVLSGGEQQKLFLARMLYKNGDIFIMDEASAALDPISEYEINKLMMKVSKNKTVVIISHRLSTVVDADKIYLIDNGSIIEEGNHKELVALNGKYARMFNAQAENYLKS